MKQLDLSRNSRIPLLMELVNSMNRLAEPHELVEQFVHALSEAYGRPCVVQLQTRGLGAGEYRVLRVFRGQQGAASPDPRGPVCRGGLLGKVIAVDGPAIWHELEAADDPVLGRDVSGYHSMMAVPLLDSGLGVDWVVILRADAAAFQERDLEEMILRSNLVAAMAGNLNTARQLMKASILIQREIEQISRIQQALLPEELPQIPGLKLAASYRTFDRAGGDLYDVAPVGHRSDWLVDEEDDRWLLLIGDVSGHGPAAAVVMAMFHSILHSYPRRPCGPAELLTHVNRHLCAKRIEQSFVTAFLGFYDPGSRELVYARAGHDPPILKQFPHAGPPTRLDKVGELPLGIIPDVQYSEAKVTLRPGQTLILYTDGITEAKGERGLFGMEGIENSLIACTGEPPCAVKHINDALEAHQTELRPADDQTIVAVQVV